MVLPDTALSTPLPTGLVFGQAAESAQTPQALQGLHTAIRTHLPRPNVVLIVLESVGTKQLFRADRSGKLDPQVVPNLARLSERSLIFDSIYTIFPATVYAHVPLMTGGRSITHGNVFDELSASYGWPTLPRVLQQNGYRTGFVSASDLTFANLGPYLRSTGFEYFFFGATQLPRNERKQAALNSWGAMEEVALTKALHWLDTIAASEQPFFPQWLTLATHHPYSTPADYPELFGEGEENRRSHYWNALHYTDAMVGRLIDGLAARGLLDNTLVLVTGDHGEGFGQWHNGAFSHGPHLYEEHVKTFLMVSTRHAPAPPVMVDRIGSFGDILPTLLSLLGMDAVAVPGQDLFSPAYTPRPVFFQNTHLPRRWGLRDGQWKFIAAINGTETELYDLTTDPDEQVNLAPAYPAHIQTYRQLCTHWYLTQNADYVALLK